MSWYSGATARPPGEWLHPGLHPWWGYGAHAHAISALSQSIATSLDERGFYQQLIYCHSRFPLIIFLRISFCQQHQTLIRTPTKSRQSHLSPACSTGRLDWHCSASDMHRNTKVSLLDTDRGSRKIKNAQKIAISFLSYKLHWKYNSKLWDHL